MSLGWQFACKETLGMTVVRNRNSAWYGITPIPRMVQNQLGHLLELKMIELDREILKALQDVLEEKSRKMWVVATLAVFLLLHIRELDAGRNIFWRRYEDIV